MFSKYFQSERYPTKIGAAFNTEQEARHTLTFLQTQPALDDAEVTLLKPNDPLFESKIERDSEGVKKTLIRSHYTLGAMGFLIGLLLYIVLYFNNVAAVEASPFYSALLIVLISTLAGLIAGGFVGVRPDHDRLINFSRSETDSGNWVVMVHTKNAEQKSSANQLLNSTARNVVATL